MGLAQSREAALSKMACSLNTGVGRGLALDVNRSCLLCGHALVTCCETDLDISGTDRVRDVTDSHESRAAKTVHCLCRGRVWEACCQRRSADLVARRWGMASACYNVLHLLWLDSRLGDTLVEELVEQTISRGVAEASLLPPC